MEIWGAAIAAGATLAGTAATIATSGGGQSQTTSANLGAADTLRQNWQANQYLGYEMAGGGAWNYAGAQPQLYGLGPEEEQFRQQMMGYANRPQLTPEQYRSNVLGSLDMQGGAAQQYLNQIVTPSLSNKYTAMGMGRSGALGESLAMAGTQMALPLAQQRAQWEMNYPVMLGNLNEANMSLYGQGMAVAGAPRNLQLQDYLRRQKFHEFMQGSMTGMNPSSQSTTKSGDMSAVGETLPMLGLLGMSAYNQYKRAPSIQPNTYSGGGMGFYEPGMPNQQYINQSLMI